MCIRLITFKHIILVAIHASLVLAELQFKKNNIVYMMIVSQKIKDDQEESARNWNLI